MKQWKQFIYFGTNTHTWCKPNWINDLCIKITLFGSCLNYPPYISPSFFNQFLLWHSQQTFNVIVSTSLNLPRLIEDCQENQITVTFWLMQTFRERHLLQEMDLITVHVEKLRDSLSHERSQRILHVACKRERHERRSSWHHYWNIRQSAITI